MNAYPQWHSNATIAVTDTNVLIDSNSYKASQGGVMQGELSPTNTTAVSDADESELQTRPSR